MYLTIKQQVKHLTKEEFKSIKELSHTAKNLYNQGLYNIRQHYFKNKEYLSYEDNYALLKNSENYKLLNSNMAQQILKEVDGTFKSFFALIKSDKIGKVNIPKYLKKDGFTTLVIGFVRVKGNKLLIPYSQMFRKTHKPITINMPPLLANKKIKEIRIIPKSNATFFEIQYIYQVELDDRKLNPNNIIAVDLGVNNLTTCATNGGKTFIVDGRKLKSINQWFNKRNAYLQSIKDKQGMQKRITKQQAKLYRKRNNQVNDYIAKTARIIINYCIDNNIGTLVIGYNETLQRGVNIGKANNQNLVNIPLGNLKEKLKYLCQLYGIRFIKQEESYTSRASFFDNDHIPTYHADNSIKHRFSGTRVNRGLYKHTRGLVNADVNGALNIMRKSSVVDLTVLCSRGEVNTPVRIRV